MAHLITEVEEPLTKSYINTVDPDTIKNKDKILNDVYDIARKDGNETLFVNIDTGERLSSLTALEKVSVANINFCQRKCVTCK